MKKSGQESIEEFVARSGKKYRMALTEKKLPDIELKPSERITLSLCRESKYAPTMLETKDIDELKSWMGTSDTVFDSRPCKHHRCVRDWHPAGLTGSSRDNGAALKRTIETLKAGDHQKIKQITKAYIYGDSRQLVQYKPLVEKYWEKFRIPIWLFKRIYVPAGAVVTLSPGNAGVLWAYSIEIEEGGKVLCQGSMTFDVSKIKKV